MSGVESDLTSNFCSSGRFIINQITLDFPPLARSGAHQTNMNTQNLSQFGFREWDIASQLLHALAENNWNSEADGLGDGMQLEFNPQSTCVFLTDNKSNVVMLNQKEKLENWLSCWGCREEGFRSEVSFSHRGLCEKCAKKESKK